VKNHMQSIAIVAGKGGVGKSSVTVNLALALIAQGARVGILDADLYGPSIGKMVPAEKPPYESEHGFIPAEGLGLYALSLAYFSLGKQATIVRAPIANQIITEFIHQVQWPKLDFLLIDFPPGTGDIQLTLMQQAALSAAVLVTTPQEVALLDVEKAYSMLQQMRVPVLGVIENMSYYEHREIKAYPFGQGGAVRFCQHHGLRFLGEIPLDPVLSRCCDQGISLLHHFPGSGAALSFEQIAQEIQLCLLNKKQTQYLVEFIEQEAYHFSVTWGDSKTARYSFTELQRNCPCTQCRDDQTGRFKRDRTQIPEKLKAKKIVNVGNYALKIEFESGCQSGIYTHSFLKRLAELEHVV
jgi:ATP-binding protein involved in chromosome partitioning